MSVHYGAAGAATARAVAFLVAGWSGCFIMSLELLSSRVLAPYFGSSVFVWGGILAVFMAALALGYLLGGALSTESPRLWKLAGLLSAEALLTLPVMASDGVLENLSLLVPDPRYGSLLGSLLLFGLPTVITGTISPYTIRLLVKGVRTSGREAGLVYFVSTLGSAAGTITTAFYLVLWLDIHQILLVMVGISLAIAGLAVCLSPRLVMQEDGHA